MELDLDVRRQPDPAWSCGWGEPDPFAVQVSFEDQDLVPQREYLGVFVAVAHR
jgi:hypothetical protein